MKSVVITGVSSGIGWGSAKVLVERGFRVFGSVRKTSDAERLSTEFGKNFVPLIFDVTDQAAVQKAASLVREQLAGETLFGLVNNAGVAFPAPLVYQPIEDYRKQLDVNLVGPLIVTQAFADMLGVDRSRKGAPGRVVNIGSVGGKIAGLFIGAYHASKFGLEGLSETLRHELFLYGIDVVLIGPGAVATTIWDKADAVDLAPYEKTEYGPALQSFKKYFIESGRKGYSAERIGALVHKALTVRKPRVRYGFAAVHHPITRWLLLRILPKRTIDKVLAKNMGWLDAAKTATNKDA